jgi:hypothetical protein
VGEPLKPSVGPSLAGLTSFQRFLMRVTTHQNKFMLIGLLASMILTSCSEDKKMAAYNLWKLGSLAYDAEVIEYGLRRDPEAAKLVVGKSLEEVRAMFKDVHESTGSFSILVSKNLRNRPSGRKYFQWEQRYVVFEVEGDRVVALSFVYG